MSRAIIIFARSPRAEAIAKRLDDSAVRLFAAVARSWRDVARATSAELLIACDPAHRSEFELLGLTTCIEQSGETFGERLGGATATAFGRGFETVAVTGIDAPPPESHELERAFAAVERGLAPAAIAPSCDGGLNLILLQAGDVALLLTFARGARDLVGRCRDYFGDALHLLAPAHDIDSRDSLAAVSTEVAWRRFRRVLSVHRWTSTEAALSPCEHAFALPVRAPPAAFPR
jgi:glycosyltransferase A (GT-A) superfamily protein (DUF2064 family)